MRMKLKFVTITFFLTYMVTFGKKNQHVNFMKILVLALTAIMAFPVFSQQSDPWQEFLEKDRQRTHEIDMQKRWLEDAEKARQQSERDRQRDREAMEIYRAPRETQPPIQQPDQNRPRNCMLISNIVHCY